MSTPSAGVASSDDGSDGHTGFDADNIEGIAQALKDFIVDQRQFINKLPASSDEVASAFDAAEKCLSETLRFCATPTDASLNAKEAAGNVLANIARVFKSLTTDDCGSPSGTSDSDDSAQISLPVSLKTPVVPLPRSSQLKWPELKMYLDSMKPLMSHPRFHSFVHLAVLSVDGLAETCTAAAAMPMGSDEERTAVASLVIDSGVVIPTMELFIAVFGDIGSSAISCNQDLLLRAGFSADEVHAASEAGMALNAALDLDVHAPEGDEVVAMEALGELLVHAAAMHSAGRDAATAADGAAAGESGHPRHGRGHCGRGRGRGRRHCGHRHRRHLRQEGGAEGEVQPHPHCRRHRHRRHAADQADGTAAGAASTEHVHDTSEHAGGRGGGRCRRGGGGGGWRRHWGGRRDDTSDQPCKERSWRHGGHHGRQYRAKFWQQLASAAGDAEGAGGAAWVDALRKHVGGPCRWRRRQAATAAAEAAAAAAAPAAPGTTPPANAPDADDLLIQEAIRQSLDMRRTMASTPTTSDVTVNTSAPVSALETTATASQSTTAPAVTAALQRLPAGSSFAGDDLAAKFVSHLTVADHNAVSPASTFIKAWRVQNTSSSAWPEGVRLVCVGGHPLGLSDAGQPVPAVPAGDTVDISVKLTAPPYPGRNVGYYRLVTADGTRFGHRLWCDLVVDNSNVAAVLKAMRQAGALPGSTSVVTQTSPRAEGTAVAAAAAAAGTPEEQDGYVVVPSADKLPTDAADKRVSLRARARGRSGTGSSVASFDGAQGSASMEASMSDCGTPGAEAHRDASALDAAVPVAETSPAQPATTEPAAADAGTATDGDVPAHMAQYEVQLHSLRELGFEDSTAFAALVEAKGNVSAAVAALCGE